MAKITLPNGSVLEGTIEEIRKFLTEQSKTDGPLQPAFQIGDYVRIVSEENNHPKIIGKIVKIDTKDDQFLYLVDFLYGYSDYTAWYGPNGLVKVGKEEALWLSIGRKIGEFKKGDIVMYTPNSAENSINMHLGLKEYIGIFTEVEQAEGSFVCFKKLPFVNNSCGTCTSASELKLIVPVEYRFDLK